VLTRIRKGRPKPSKEALREDLARSIATCDTYFDFGANTGQQIPLIPGSVDAYLFEPDPIAFSVLSTHCAQSGNITAINGAVWIRNGKKRLFRHRDFLNYDDLTIKTAKTVSSSLMASKNNVDRRNTVEVQVFDVVQVVRQKGCGQVVMKMDIEGAETAVLLRLGFSKAARSVSTLYVESEAHKIPLLRFARPVVRIILHLTPLRGKIRNWY